MSIDHIDAKIVVILSENPGSYGLEIVKIGNLSRSDIYVRLAKLEELGLIRHELEPDTIAFVAGDAVPMPGRRKYWAT